MLAHQNEGLSRQDIPHGIIRSHKSREAWLPAYLDIPLTGCPHHRAPLLPYFPVLMLRDSLNPTMWSEVHDHQACLSSLVAHSFDRFLELFL